MKKILILACLILGLSSLSRAQGVSVSGQAIVNTPTSVSGIPGNTVLQAVPNAQITVCLSTGGGIPCTPLVANIFSDAALTVPTANPLTADLNGNFQFFIAPNSTGYLYSQTAPGIVGQLFKILPQTTNGAGIGGSIASGQVAVGSGANMISGSAFLTYVAGLFNINGTGSQTVLGVTNSTAATNVLGQSSPLGCFTGQYWTGGGSAPDTFCLQNVIPNGTNPISVLTLTHFGSVNGIGFSAPSLLSTGNVTANGDVVGQSSNNSFDFDTGGAGTVFVMTSVANAIGNTTTYTHDTSTGSTKPGLGMIVVIAGFANGVNNGTFTVQSSDNTHITVFNSSGVAEIHAATGTENLAIGNTQNAATLGSTSPVTIQGQSYNVGLNYFEMYPFSPVVVAAKGNARDAGYFRIINDGSTGNHGLEIAGIIDGTGAAPAIAHLGIFNGVSGFGFPHLSPDTGLQIFNTTTTCTTAAAVGATCTTPNITIPVAEPDTSYRAVCIGKNGFSNVPVVIATNNASVTQFTITIAALTAAAASFASYDCSVGHN